MKKRLRESWFFSARKYLKESSFYVSLTVALFFFSAFISFLQPNSFSFLNELLKGLIDKTQGLGTPQLIAFIFYNNASSAFVALFAGMIFAFVPFFNILLNGVLLGYVVSRASEVSTVSDILLRLLPHGVFELPAIFIAVGLGIKLGMAFFGTYFVFYSKKRKMRFWGSLAISATFISLFLLFSSAQIFSSNSASTGAGLFFMFSFLTLSGSAFWLLFLLFGDATLRVKQVLTFKERMVKSFHVFITIIVPLLIIAAIIEGFLIYFL